MQATPQMSERQLQDCLVEAATLCGWLHFHDLDSRKNEAGFPDLILVHPKAGRLLVVECKSARGRVTPAQERWLAAFATVPGVRVEVWRPKDLDEALNILATPMRGIRCSASSMN